jgi:FkbM family methyltransferase
MTVSHPNFRTRLMTMPDGGRLEIPNNNRLMTPYILQEQEDWFEDEIHFIRRWLKPGMCVVDVGANYGVYTCAAACSVGPTGSVISFEPAALPYSCLKRSIADNGWSQVTLHKEALSDHRGSARLGIHAHAELNSLSQVGGQGEEVVLGTLDDYADTIAAPVDFLKLDAEGEEVRILSASSRFFARHNPLVMFEYKHDKVVNHGLIAAIKSLGMDIYRLVPGACCLVPLDESVPGDDFLLNLFGCRPGRAESLEQQEFLLRVRPVVVEPIAQAEAELQVRAWIAARPWAAKLWPSGLPTERRPGQDRYICAMAEILSAEDPQRPAAARYAGFVRALELLTQEVSSSVSVPRGLTLARVQMALGFQSESMRTLRSLEQVFAQRGTVLGFCPNEMLLPADSLHDALAPGFVTDPGLIIQVMLDETLLTRAAYSTFFTRGMIPGLLARLASNPLITPGAQRRLAMARNL